MKTKKKNLFLSGKIIQTILYILFSILIIVLLIEYRIIDNPLNLFNNKIIEIETKDLCSIIGGKLIHTLKDSESCKNKCIVECESSKAKFEEHEFQNEINNCNKCKCYCTSE